MSTILIIEDNPLLKMANESLLKKAGYDVLIAGDGVEGVSQVKRFLPDVVLLDMMLPKLSGPDVLKSIKNDPATASIPVIVLTSLSQKNEEKLKLAGATIFLEKGSLLNNPEPLFEAIQQALNSKPRNSPSVIEHQSAF